MQKILSTFSLLLSVKCIKFLICLLRGVNRFNVVFNLEENRLIIGFWLELLAIIYIKHESHTVLRRI